MSSSKLQELFVRYPHNPIIVTKDLPYQANTVFNAAAALVAGQTLLLIRIEDRRGISHLTVARSKDGITNWQIDAQPTFPPDSDHFPEELWGVEDPRITFMDELGEYYFTYTAYSLDGPLVSLAKTKDFIHFERLGSVLLPENKDAALFPRRINGRWAMLHRHVLHSGAHIWIAFSPDLKHWGDHKIVMRARTGGWWDANKIGLSPQPLYTPEGWLILFHGVRVTGGGVIYRLGLALLDLENPARLLRRSEEWIFGPMESYERNGDVDNVVFPCGWIQQGDEIRLYYGGADTCIALAIASLKELQEYLRHCPEK
jgi:predicted GH43/DUF377 family glycosyl hydrolase